MRTGPQGQKLESVMHTAPNPKTVGTNVRRAWHAGANQSGGNAGGSPVPHVLLRLPRIGADEAPAPESSSNFASDRTTLRVDPPVINKSYAALQRDLTSREHVGPGPLTDFHGWLANGGKVWLTIVALLVANGVVLMWRQSPAPQVVAPTFEQEHSALQPIPLDDSMTTSDQTATAESLRPTPRIVGEPTLAPPRPEPDTLNAPAFDEPVAEADPLPQEPTLAPSRPEPILARQVPTIAPKREPTPAAESPVVTSESTSPTAAPKTATAPMPAVGKSDPKDDVPPWESWNDKSQVAQQTPPTETVTAPQPTLAPPKDSVEAKTQPPEPRTAAVTQATPTVVKPKSVAKLKGKINKPLSEPGNEHTRRSLY